MKPFIAPAEAPALWLIGASGPTGRALSALLDQAGIGFLPCSRETRTSANGTRPWHRFGLETDRQPCDAEMLVSLGPLDRFTDWLSRIETPNLRRVVALGSMSAEFKRASPSAAERALAATLRASEQKLQEVAAARKLSATLIRTSMIWNGIDDRNIAPLLAFARRWRLLPTPIGAGGWRNPIHCDDLARVVLLQIERHPQSAVPLMIAVGGPEKLRMRELFRRIADHAHALPLPLPLPMLRLAAGMVGKSGAVAALARWHDDQLAPMLDDANARRFLR